MSGLSVIKEWWLPHVSQPVTACGDTVQLLVHLGAIISEPGCKTHGSSHLREDLLPFDTGLWFGSFHPSSFAAQNNGDEQLGVSKCSWQRYPHTRDKHPDKAGVFICLWMSLLGKFQHIWLSPLRFASKVEGVSPHFSQNRVNMAAHGRKV